MVYLVLCSANVCARERVCVSMYIDFTSELVRCYVWWGYVQCMGSCLSVFFSPFWYCCRVASRTRALSRAYKSNIFDKGRARTWHKPTTPKRKQDFVRSDEQALFTITCRERNVHNSNSVWLVYLYTNTNTEPNKYIEWTKQIRHLTAAICSWTLYEMWMCSGVG